MHKQALLTLLESSNLLNEANQTLINHLSAVHIDALCETTAILHQLNRVQSHFPLLIECPILLEKDNANILAQILNKKDLYVKGLARAIHTLNTHGILEQEIATIIDAQNGVHPKSRANLVIFLHQNALLTAHNRTLLTKRRQLGKYLDAFLILKKASLLSQESIDAIFKEGCTAKINKAFKLLHQKNLLTQERLTHLLTHPSKATFTQHILDALNKNHPNIPEIWDCGVQYPQYLDCDIQSTLLKAHLLTQDNLSLLHTCNAQAYPLSIYLNRLLQLNVLTSENYQFLTQHAAILFHPKIRLHPGFYIEFGRTIDLAAWQHIINICTHATTKDERVEALFQYITTRVATHRQQPTIQNIRAFNRAQSTHTASIHCSTDLSHWLLMTTHQGTMDEHALLQDLSARIKNATHQHRLIAIQALHRIIKIKKNINIGTDQKQKCLDMIHDLELNQITSISDMMGSLEASKAIELKLTFKQSILLFYQETQNCPDVIDSIISALYEIERGKGFNEAGVDINPNHKKNQICPDGTPNKFCEKLSSYSPKIQHVFAAPENIALKIKILLLNAIRHDVERMLTQSNNQDFFSIMDDMSDTEKASRAFEQYWEKYKTKIENEIMSEFSSYISTNQIEKLFSEFKSHVLIDMPSPTETETGGYLSIGFIAWFKEKQIQYADIKRAIANQPILYASSNNILFPIPHKKRAYGKVETYIASDDTDFTSKRMRTLN